MWGELGGSRWVEGEGDNGKEMNEWPGLEMLFDGRREEAVRISMKEGVSDRTIRKRIIVDWVR